MCVNINNGLILMILISVSGFLDYIIARNEENESKNNLKHFIKSVAESLDFSPILLSFFLVGDTFIIDSSLHKITSASIAFFILVSFVFWGFIIRFGILKNIKRHTDPKPDDEYAKNCIIRLYSTDGGTKQVTAKIFDDNLAGENPDSRHDNMLLLVRFCLNKCLMTNHHPDGSEPDLMHFCEKLETICKLLKRRPDQLERYSAYAEELTAIIKKSSHIGDAPQVVVEREELSAEEHILIEDIKHNLKEEAAYGEELLKIAKESPARINLPDYYRFIIDNWIHLKDKAITYSLLSDLVRLDGMWIDTPASRTEFVDIIKGITKERE